MTDLALHVDSRDPGGIGGGGMLLGGWTVCARSEVLVGPLPQFQMLQAQ